MAKFLSLEGVLDEAVEIEMIDLYSVEIEINDRSLLLGVCYIIIVVLYQSLLLSTIQELL